MRDGMGGIGRSFGNTTFIGFWGALGSVVRLLARSDLVYGRFLDLSFF